MREVGDYENHAKAKRRKGRRGEDHESTKARKIGRRKKEKRRKGLFLVILSYSLFLQPCSQALLGNIWFAKLRFAVGEAELHESAFPSRAWEQGSREEGGRGCSWSSFPIHYSFFSFVIS
jgi:hypothetical protein